MDVLLSIKPKYAEAIYSGAKRFEFRRRIFKRNDVKTVYVYSTQTVRKITGSFNVRNILVGTPHKLWRTAYLHAGIGRRDFFDYFSGCPTGYAIEIESAKRFKTPLDPYAANPDFTPPQSFCYVEDNFAELMSEASRIRL